MNWNYYERDICPCKKETKKMYQIIIMGEDGKTTRGKTYDNWEDIFNAMIELRNVYTKMEINQHVGFMEV